MDGEILPQKISLMIPASPSGAVGGDGNLATQCRTLISVLSRKIETLCHECDVDADRVIHIRSLTASLTTLNTLLKSLEHERLYRPERGLLEDARGFTYVSVRHCELERWLNEK
jgi:hypothetical protein